MSQKYPFNVTVLLSPHPAFGHPLPIRWGEGRVRGVAVSNLVGVIVKKCWDATLDWLFYRPTKRRVLATQASVRTPGNVGMFPYDRCQAFNQRRERCCQDTGGTDPTLPEQALAV